jgi:hypothetical protein
MGFFKIKSKEEKFWEWFVNDEKFISNWKNDQDAVFQKLIDKLREVKKDLCFEFGPSKNGKQEIVISADGIISLIDSVKALVGSAPELKGWKVTAFRPRVGTDIKLNLGGLEIDNSDIYFSFLESTNNRLPLQFYIKDYQENDKRYMAAIFRFLDFALGEYDVMTRIGEIKITELPTNHKELAVHEFSKLPDYFNRKFANS